MSFFHHKQPVQRLHSYRHTLIAPHYGPPTSDCHPFAGRCLALPSPSQPGVNPEQPKTRVRPPRCPMLFSCRMLDPYRPGLVFQGCPSRAPSDRRTAKLILPCLRTPPISMSCPGFRNRSASASQTVSSDATVPIRRLIASTSRPSTRGSSSGSTRKSTPAATTTAPIPTTSPASSN